MRRRDTNGAGTPLELMSCFLSEALIRRPRVDETAGKGETAIGKEAFCSNYSNKWSESIKHQSICGGPRNPVPRLVALRKERRKGRGPEKPKDKGTKGRRNLVDLQHRAAHPPSAGCEFNAGNKSVRRGRLLYLCCRGHKMSTIGVSALS